MLWDRGYWEPEGNRSPEEALAKGDFKFKLKGDRLHGSFVLVRMRHDRDGGKRTNWLLIKHHEAFSVDENGGSVLDEHVTSVASGRTMDEIASGKGRKPKRFMLSEAVVEADAVWDSSQGLAAEKRKAGRNFKPKGSRKPTSVERPSSAMPDFIAPQLCETLDRPPSGKGWIHEIKFDGYRIQMRVENSEVTLKTRKGLD